MMPRSIRKLPIGGEGGGGGHGRNGTGLLVAESVVRTTMPPSTNARTTSLAVEVS